MCRSAYTSSCLWGILPALQVSVESVCWLFEFFRDCNAGANFAIPVFGIKEFLICDPDRIVEFAVRVNLRGKTAMFIAPAVPVLS